MKYLELSFKYMKDATMEVVYGDIEDFVRREDALRILNGECPYREMFKGIYPDLFHAENRKDNTIIEK